MGANIGHQVKQKKGKGILTVAIAANICVLGVFKYTNFFIETANYLGTRFEPFEIVLPLGISFFTFTQITFLVDAYLGIAKEYQLVDYILFVTWFPHLIAGPILHHKQMMPNLQDRRPRRLGAQSQNMLC